MEDVFAQYYENLLRAQYVASDSIRQMHPRGTIREDFLRDFILSRKDSLRGRKGIICKNSNQSGECDLIFYNTSSVVSPLVDQEDKS